jgi:hypothetical protein
MKFIQRDKIHRDRNPKSPILGKHTTSVQTRLESPKAPNHKNALSCKQTQFRAVIVIASHDSLDPRTRARVTARPMN